MWKRDEAVRPANAGAGGTKEQSKSAGPAASARQPAGATTRPPEKDVVHIGKSVVIKGELNGGEDLTIEGQVDGKTTLVWVMGASMLPVRTRCFSSPAEA